MRTPLQFTTRTGLIIVLVAFWLVGCTSSMHIPSTPSSQSTGSANVHRFDGGSIEVDTRTSDCRVTLRGDIQNATIRRLTPLLDQVEQARCTSKRLLLDTNNGWLGDAITLGAMVRNRGYDTQVLSGSTCQTPCLLVFAAGQTRVVPEHPTPGRIAFSQIPPDQDFGTRTCATELSNGQHLTLTRYLRAMLGTQTGTAVYRKLLAATCDRTDVYGPAEALAMGLATATR